MAGVKGANGEENAGKLGFVWLLLSSAWDSRSALEDSMTLKRVYGPYSVLE